MMTYTAKLRDLDFQIVYAMREYAEELGCEIIQDEVICNEEQMKLLKARWGLLTAS